MRGSLVAGATLILVACATLIAPAAAPAHLRLSPADYAVSAICAQPAPGYSGCLSLRLVADEPSAVPGAKATPRATEYTEPIRGSLTPANLIDAYGLSGATPPSTQTIALVDAYDDATIAGDLEVFSQQFGLPACNEANGCFRKVNQSGEASPLPASGGKKERGWAQEIATDVEIAHGVCQSCRILLVEADSNANRDLYAAEQTAAALGAEEISNSWGGQEGSADSAAFDHPGIVITASSGDDGYLDWLSEEPSAYANYPASSPHVIGVGGTRLTLSPTGTWESERSGTTAARATASSKAPAPPVAAAAGTSPQAAGSRACPTGQPSAAAVHAPSPTSQRTGTPTAGSPCTTRPKRPTAKRAGRRSAAPAWPRRSSPRSSRSPAGPKASPTRRNCSTKTCSKTRRRCTT